jgi:hypothetical protein
MVNVVCGCAVCGTGASYGAAVGALATHCARHGKERGFVRVRAGPANRTTRPVMSATTQATTQATAEAAPPPPQCSTPGKAVFVVLVHAILFLVAWIGAYRAAGSMIKCVIM